MGVRTSFLGFRAVKPTKAELLPIVQEVVQEHKDELKGAPGEPGKPGEPGPKGLSVRYHNGKRVSIPSTITVDGQTDANGRVTVPVVPGVLTSIHSVHASAYGAFTQIVSWSATEVVVDAFIVSKNTRTLAVAPAGIKVSIFVFGSSE